MTNKFKDKNDHAKKNVHVGHRTRLKHKLVNDSSETIEPHELLEILLFYCIARRNTNEIAHELLDSFGSLSNLINANSEDIKNNFYVKDSSAALILALGEMKRRRNKMAEKYCFSFDYKRCSNSVLKLMKNADREGVYVIWVNRSGGLLSATYLANDAKRLEEKLFFCRNLFDVGVGGAVIVDFSKNCSLIPGNIVLEKMKAYEEKLDLYSVPMFEYYLFNGKKVAGIRGNNKYNLFFVSGESATITNIHSKISFL